MSGVSGWLGEAAALGHLLGEAPPPARYAPAALAPATRADARGCAGPWRYAGSAAVPSTCPTGWSAI